MIGSDQEQLEVKLKNESGDKKRDLVIVGIGNPGRRYRYTRHNVGFMVVDRLALILQVKWCFSFFKKYDYGFFSRTDGRGRVILLKPKSYVNRSGLAVGEFCHRYNLLPQDFLVVFDHLDLPPGRLRIKTGGSSAGHNGLKSINYAFNSSAFPRMAFGIGRPPYHGSVVQYVLEQFFQDEQEKIAASIDKAAAFLQRLCLGTELSKIMAECNRKIDNTINPGKDSGSSLQTAADSHGT